MPQAHMEPLLCIGTWGSGQAERDPTHRANSPESADKHYCYFNNRHHSMGAPRSPEKWALFPATQWFFGIQQ